MNASQFLDAAERRGLLSGTTLDRLRQQLSESSRPITPEKLAQLLVEKKLLTMLQAGQILEGQGEEELELLHDEDVGDQDELVLLESEDLKLVASDSAEDLAAEPPQRPSAASAQRSKPSTHAAKKSWEGPPEDVPAPDSLSDVLSGERIEDPAVSGDYAIGMRRGGMWRRLARGLRPRSGTHPVHRWDSKLILLGGGGLILLVLAGLMLYFLLTRGSGDELYQLAEDDYASQSYLQAIAKYERFLDRFPRHPKATQARVRVGLARMRQKVEASDWDGALKTCGEEIARIRSEAAFQDARPELAGVLTALYQGLVEDARKRSDITEKKSRLDQAARALQWIDDPEILPTSQRQAVQDGIDRTSDQVQLIRRDVRREESLQTALGAVRQALANQQVAEAYRLRDALLAEFPGLSQNAALGAELRAITLAEQKLIRPCPDAPPANTEEDRPAAARRVVLADRQVQAAADTDQVLCLLARGAVYGLSARDGKFLWRRWVGHESQVWPDRVISSTDPDALVLDEQRHELLRLAHATGDLRWRLPLEGLAVGQVVYPDRVYVASDRGRLWQVQVESGAATCVEFPQPLATVPAYDAESGQIYQLGQHSSLFVLDANDLSCKGSTYVGHAPGTVSVPPLVVGNALLICENIGPDASRLRAFSRTPNDDGSLPALGEPWRLEGQVHEPATLVGSRVAITTQRGATYVLEVDSAGEPPLRQVASSASTDAESIQVFSVSQGDRLILAGSSLAEVQLQAARGSLVRRWFRDEGSVHLAAPQFVAPDILVEFTRPQDSDGVRAAALQVPLDGDSVTPLWTMQLGQSPATHALVDRIHKNIVVIAENGLVWNVTSDAVAQGILDQRDDLGRQPTAVESVLEFPDGRMGLTLADRSPALLVFDPSATSRRWSRLELAVPHPTLACSPVARGDRILVCTQDGPIYLVDSRTGKPLATPFQLPLAPKQQIAWVRPVPLSDTEWVVAEANGQIYRLQLVAGQSPGLTPKMENHLRMPLGLRLGILADTVFAVEQAAEQDRVWSIDGGNLKPLQSWPVDGRATWGPSAVAADILGLATDSGTLMALDSAEQPRWTAKLPHGRLAGAPLAHDGTWICGTLQGEIWKLRSDTGAFADSASGSDPAAWHLGETLGAGPQLLGDRLLLLGTDSTLHLVPLADVTP